MLCHQGEVGHHDPAALMDLLHRRARVRFRAAKCGREELDLLTLQSVHVGAGKKAGQLIVGKYPGVEVLYDDFDRLVAADRVVDAGRLGRRNCLASA
jgi:hypothetical protein